MVAPFAPRCRSCGRPPLACPGRSTCPPATREQTHRFFRFVMQIYREILPNSYLLILGEDQRHPEEYGLARALQQAARSGKASIWVDCSALRHMSRRALILLTDYYQRLRRRNTQLVLCHLTDDMQESFRDTPEAACPPIVSTLLDAALYCQAVQQDIAPAPATTTAGWGVALS